MSFEHPWIFLLLILAVVPVLLAMRSIRRRKKLLEIYASGVMGNRLLLGESPRLRWIRVIILSLAIVFMVIAAAGPQINGGKEKVKIRGIDIVVAMDVSTSMLAQDLKPSRIEKAKLALTDLLEKLEGDRLGVVVFAAQPYTVLPLCDDRSAAEMILNTVSVETVSAQGTDIASAIDHAVFSFNGSESDRGKAIIVISDGENHEEDAADAAARAAEKGIIVCTIGIGSSSGTTIPVKDENGKVTNKRDGSGNEVITKLNDAALKEIAREGNGSYVKATNSDLGLNEIMGQLRELSKTTSETERYTSFTPVYYFASAFVVLLLIVELLMAEGKRKKLKKA
ncbi:MAG: VWA domain-containing protein [Bacteroidia bacterium]|nr:VWA domain-containing protein [Bacteroidia bacterium]